ncbi:DUF262 domain-containing protein [Helicobacter sp. 14348-15]|uniref:DUF262 domain-containing protein n=1 Tax=Helicobacter colisuis TaxID=2949739 RepID=UPI00202BA304|nr:DUF262 domain-containing protein [Helicobacter colisuis]MCL9821759.1 DUF262 domain-containing protein [Helicobacter colisuis]
MKTFNLSTFLQEYNVEIPMLQRDYAQGRISNEKVAKDFLKAIFDALDSDEGKLHIDFIYGYQDNEKFYLIDGQQRITTLWLLHVYFHKFLGEIPKDSYLYHFSYSVRVSSKTFCKKLLKENFIEDKKPSEAILLQGGTFANEEDLRSDPTIKAMLHMLDLIHEKTLNKDINKLINRLQNLTFYLFDMGKFELGEELYIKMNARGKQLSKYENLKAFIEESNELHNNQEICTKIDTI